LAIGGVESHVELRRVTTSSEAAGRASGSAADDELADRPATAIEDWKIAAA
jgi:hypothetical protein